MLLRLWRLYRSPVWEAAKRAVNHVESDNQMQLAAEREDMITYCPRCGQRPTDDRRMEEARQLAMVELVTRGLTPRKSDLDYALAWHAWRVNG